MVRLLNKGLLYPKKNMLLISIVSLWAHIFFSIQPKPKSPNAQCVLLLNFFPISFVEFAKLLSKWFLPFLCWKNFKELRMEPDARANKMQRYFYVLLFGTDHKILSFRNDFHSQDILKTNFLILSCDVSDNIRRYRKQQIAQVFRWNVFHILRTLTSLL